MVFIMRVVVSSCIPTSSVNKAKLMDMDSMLGFRVEALYCIADSCDVIFRVLNKDYSSVD